MQPNPIKNNSPKIVDLVIEDLKERESSGLTQKIIEDFKERDRIGRAKYGTSLQAHNGRNALQDAYEESLDQCQYLKQKLVEGFGMIKNDIWIRAMAEQGMIAPFEPNLIRQVEGNKVISYGTSSYGYDIRLSPNEFRVFRHIPGQVVDPKRFDPKNLEVIDLHEENGDRFFVLPAHSYGLGVALERIEIPSNITVICIGKSTYARCGVIANLTPGEAQWRGHLTLEFSNSSGADCRLYAGEGIVQLLFLEGDPCSTTYEGRNGKYQDQPEQVIFARV